MDSRNSFFKKGDKVKRIKPCPLLLNLDEIYIVKYQEGKYRLFIEGFDDYSFNVNYFELVTNKDKQIEFSF